MAPFSPKHPIPRVFDYSEGEILTDIGHTTIHDSGSQTAGAGFFKGRKYQYGPTIMFSYKPVILSLS
jgi:hypothetical protein